MKITEQEIKDLCLTKSKETYIEICISGDVNDGDYINSTNRINVIEKYLEVLNISNKIDSYGCGHNWLERNVYLTRKEIDTISKYLPYMDNEEIHTIDSISFTFVIDGVLYE